MAPLQPLKFYPVCVFLKVCILVTLLFLLFAFGCVVLFELCECGCLFGSALCVVESHASTLGRRTLTGDPVMLFYDSSVKLLIV